MVTLEYNCAQDQVLVRPDERKDTLGGIVLVETSELSRIRTGVVVKTGPGKYAEATGFLIPMEVSAGCRVEFGRSLEEIECGDEKLYIMPAGNIRMWLPPEPPPAI